MIFIKIFRHKNIFFNKNIRTCTSSNFIQFPTLSETGLHRQMFNHKKVKTNSERMQNSLKSMENSGLLNDLLTKPPPDKQIDPLLNELTLPMLRGKTLEEHFYVLASEFNLPYQKIINAFLEKTSKKTLFEQVIKEFDMRVGWTKYSFDANKNIVKSVVDGIDEPFVVFDVETSVLTRNLPVMAIAYTGTTWYCWCSPLLFASTEQLAAYKIDTELVNSFKGPYKGSNVIDRSLLIPFGKYGEKQPQVIVGHNVAFDRSYIVEEYNLRPGFRYFVDTMSMHQVIGGLSRDQRISIKNSTFQFETIDSIIKRMHELKINVEQDEIENNNDDTNNSADQIFRDDYYASKWIDYGACNSLVDLTHFYLNLKVEKSTRDFFVYSPLSQIKSNFQQLVNYCSLDVMMTAAIFQKIYPLYINWYCPSPVSFAGTLMLSKCYIPLDDSWTGYLHRCDVAYKHACEEMMTILKKRATETVFENMIGHSFKNDPFVKYLDWTVILPDEKKYNASDTFCEEVFKAGLPKWYANLVDYIDEAKKDEKLNCLPSKIDLKHRLVPYLLKLSFNGHPIIYDSKLQWGYVLDRNLLFNRKIDIFGRPTNFKTPQTKYYIVKHTSRGENYKYGGEESYLKPEVVKTDGTVHFLLNKVYQIDYETDRQSLLIEKTSSRNNFKFKQYKKIVKNMVHNEENSSESEHDYSSIDTVYAYTLPYLTEQQVFVPIPHPALSKKLCGYPMSKEYDKYFIDGTIKPECGVDGIRYMHLLNSISYWQSNRDRIIGQFVVPVSKNSAGANYAIVPKLIPAGTITRRSVEPTWLTASNPIQTKIGSELKSIVSAPDNYVIVGADVDSEELWISSLITDASVGGFHGSTPFSFMNVAGSAASGSDFHSMTGKALKMSREAGKVVNYSRLYGASANLVVSQLLAAEFFSNGLTKKQAIVNACNMLNYTKGLRCIKLNAMGVSLIESVLSHTNDVILYNKQHNIALCKDVQRCIKKYLSGKDKLNISVRNKLARTKFRLDNFGKVMYLGGTESEFFNLIDDMIDDEHICTPLLNVKISAALATKNTGKSNFRRCKSNWMIQSSAVDFLHMFLVCVYWLFSLASVKARLAICVHDEIRFITSKSNVKRAAFCMHLANLYTRAAFCQKMGINDMPLRFAFFESVESDKSFRKDVKNESVTPSNFDGVSFVKGGGRKGRNYLMSSLLKDEKLLTLFLRFG